MKQVNICNDNDVLLWYDTLKGIEYQCMWILDTTDNYIT